MRTDLIVSVSCLQIFEKPLIELATRSGGPLQGDRPQALGGRASPLEEEAG
jgi:hypothetical protein